MNRRILNLETEITSKSYTNYFLSQLSFNMISLFSFYAPLIIIILHCCDKDTSIWKHIIGATLLLTIIKMINYAWFKTIINNEDKTKENELNKRYYWQNLNSKYINYLLELCILLIKLNNTGK